MKDLTKVLTDEYDENGKGFTYDYLLQCRECGMNEFVTELHDENPHAIARMTCIRCHHNFVPMVVPMDTVYDAFRKRDRRHYMKLCCYRIFFWTITGYFLMSLFLKIVG